VSLLPNFLSGNKKRLASELGRAKIELETAVSVLKMVVISLEIPPIDSDNIICCAGRVGSLMYKLGITQMPLSNGKRLTLKDNFLTVDTI